MEKRLLTYAEKSIGDFKGYYIGTGIISLILGAASFIEAAKRQDPEYYVAAFYIFCIPIAICTLLFILCAIEYMVYAGIRKYLYKYGTSVEGTIKKVKKGLFYSRPQDIKYYIIATYEYQGKKRKWKSPLYDEPLKAYFDIGGPCRLHVKNRLACLDEVQPLPQRDWHKVKEQLEREERIFAP